MGKMNLDDVLEQIGGCGRYQSILTLIIHSMKCIMCFSMIFMVFGAAVPDWWCADDFEGQNATETVYSHNSSQYKSCKSANGTKECSKFIFDTTIRTAISEWNLVCGLDWVPQTITSLQMFGVLVGNVACGQVADMVGRKPPLFGAIFSLVILNVIAIFSVSWVMMAVIRFFIGLSMGFQLTVHYNLMSEFTVAGWRSWVIAMPSWAIELAMFALVAWLCRDWQYLLIVTAAVGAPLLLTFRFVPESFRWYVAHDRMSDAENVIKHVAYINKKPLQDAEQLRDLMATEASSTSSSTDKKYSFYDILKNKRLLIYTLLFGFIWITLGLGGYGIQFGVTALSGNLYINIFVIAMLGSPIQFVCMWLQNRVGRKKTAVLFYGIFCITAFIVGIAQQFDESKVKDKLTSVTALVSLTAINAAWSPIQTITIETYPTVVRNIGYGIQNSMARVGAIIGPQLVFLDSKVTGLMYFVCGVAAILSMVMLIPLRETRGADLHDKILQEESSNISTESEIIAKTDEHYIIV